MKRSLAVFGLFLWLAVLTATALGAGLRFVTLPADGNGPAMRVAIWSPCTQPADRIVVGPFSLPAVRDCPIEGSALPLVVMSHGHAGTNLGHHDTAEALANAGFIVAAVNHPGDNALDHSRSGDISVMIERPEDIKRVVDYLLGAFPDASRIDSRRIGMFGFSRGGYTALVLAGGSPDFLHADLPCPEPGAPICAEASQPQWAAPRLMHDSRIKAVVVADPLNAFPTPETLQGVRIPMQLWASAHGGDGVMPAQVAALRSHLPLTPEFHDVPGSGHFAFQAPCPPDLAREIPQICTDAPGFDRAAFHATFNAEVLAFFQRTLNPTSARP